MYHIKVILKTDWYKIYNIIIGSNGQGKARGRPKPIPAHARVGSDLGQNGGRPKLPSPIAENGPVLRNRITMSWYDSPSASDYSSHVDLLSKLRQTSTCT